jgi:hypothetical protein
MKCSESEACIKLVVLLRNYVSMMQGAQNISFTALHIMDNPVTNAIIRDDVSSTKGHLQRYYPLYTNYQSSPKRTQQQLKHDSRTDCLHVQRACIHPIQT